MIDVKRLAQIGGGGGDEEGKIQRQMVLPWSEAVRISIRNVTLRLGRAAITASGVILGIAFLSSVWTSHVIQEGIDVHRAQQAQALAEAATRTPQTGSINPTESAADAEERKARDARQLWLVVMSLLVCGVGITNAMLMSVTERFREIGTMKCLGALDTFIIRLFLIEAATIGVLGSLVGVLLGHLAMILVFAIKEKSFSVIAKMDWPTMLMYLGIAVGVGTIVSLVAAVPPAMRAARMRPAVALQTEI